MPLNQLLFDHQLAKMNTGRARSDEDRTAAFDLVNDYARRITELRSAEGLSDIGWPRDERPQAFSNGVADALTVPVLEVPETGVWESEGGALRPAPHPNVPDDGMIPETMPPAAPVRYWLGPLAAREEYVPR